MTSKTKEPTVVGQAQDEEIGLTTDGVAPQHHADAAANSSKPSGGAAVSLSRRALCLGVAGLFALVFIGQIAIGHMSGVVNKTKPKPLRAAAAVAVPAAQPVDSAVPLVPADALLWDRSTRLGKDGSHSCFYRKAAYSPSVNLCVRPYSDLVSRAVRAQGDWHECRDLSRLWKSTALQEGASKNDVFFDIGANIGACTIHMAANSNAREIVAFEPSKTNLFYLTGTFLASPSFMSRLTLYPVGLGEEAADLPIYAEPGNAGHSVIGAPVGEQGLRVPTVVGTVKVRRLDDIVSPPYPKIRLMKIDVEGFEAHVLRGGRKLFSSGAVRAVYFELSPFLKGQGSSRLELINLFLEFGFEFKQLNGIPMHKSTLQNFACNEGPHRFANLFAMMAHHSPGTAQKQLPACGKR